MFKPSATYRIQFHKEFTFKHLDNLIPYFIELGVKTIYASPIFSAIPGSSHGYDGVNPHQINAEIGTEEELIELTNKLKQNGISWVQDIVPNHMSFHADNAWLMDVLEKWNDSAYFDFFDIDLSNFLTDNRLMVPFLGEPLLDAIQNSSIQLVLKEDRLFLSYGDHNWPINEASYQLVSESCKDVSSFKKWIAAEDNQKVLAANLRKINKDEALLTEILNSQYYRLCHWQETERQINYRRFFTVNSLICLNIQHDKVFDAYHHYIFDLIDRGIFQGLRIDHIDGLFDPTTYLTRLREKVGPNFYIVVEKILAIKEPMPNYWPVEGSTGYDFLATVNNLFTNRMAEKPFTSIYKEVTNKPLRVAELVVSKKRAILYEFMQGELDHLVKLFIELKLATPKEIEVLKNAIADFLIYCPVYRFYANSFPFTEDEQKAVQEVLDSIPITQDNKPGLEILKNALLAENETLQQSSLLFYQRCMQFSGPLMAKGVEDTLMYTYNRFIGHTEVGDAPEAFGISISEFHQLMATRLQQLPFSMNATATHDTKRGEDVRARLNVLTDVPQKWIRLVRQLTKNTLEDKDRTLFLHKNDAYLIFQTVLGAMYFERSDETDFESRVMEYIQKAMREAKKRSTWASPNEEYEERAKEFATSLLDLQKENHPLITSFLAEITDYSIINSLAQLLLKFTCPGIPDVYQGTELWDLSLVDPDNRRAVDYEKREKMLRELGPTPDLNRIWRDRRSGIPKLWLTRELLKFRDANQDAFNLGFYIPIEVKGVFKKNVLAFLRQYKAKWVLVAVPLGLAGINSDLANDILEFDWKDTQLILPDYAPRQWKNVFTGQTGRTDIFKHHIEVGKLFTKFPVAMLRLTSNDTKRGSGILMPIFSLPSKFGIGDIGKEAYKFVDLLAETGQKYWQLLPLNPISESNFESPYSSNSAMAGNTLFVSPELLVNKGLVKDEDIRSLRIENGEVVDYRHAREVKNELLHLAYLKFASTAGTPVHKEFMHFCKKESYWLADFSLFLALHQHHKGVSWTKWPSKYKTRDKDALESFSIKSREAIEEIKWHQFIFHQQWQELKAYAKARNIKFIGDLPFYIAFDSADVWANPKSFKLDAQLEMDVVAGVPPDRLAVDGQRWGMPIYNWKELELNKFGWWMERIQRNIELFDVVRIDHFRAIHSFWEIPASEDTARNGKWVDGPAALFLNEVCNQFHDLPFVLEDLGGDMDGAIALRDEFNLTGMKVLQFAFGEDMADSSFLPQNYENNNFMVFIGTHDNNTAKGWFRNELNNSGKQHLNAYFGATVNRANVHKKLISLALSSTAKIAIIQTQDLLGLDETARMNTPGTIQGNWLWRMKKNAFNETLKAWLLRQTIIFGRA